MIIITNYYIFGLKRSLQHRSQLSLLVGEALATPGEAFSQNGEALGRPFSKSLSEMVKGSLRKMSEIVHGSSITE